MPPMKTKEQVTIILPLPPRVLSPNCMVGSFRGRMMHAAATKKQRRTARESAEDAIRGEHWTRASMKAIFYHKTKRRRDVLNSLASLKGAIDGIVDAGLLPDDNANCLRSEGAEFAIDTEWPRVELIFTKEV